MSLHDHPPNLQSFTMTLICVTSVKISSVLIVDLNEIIINIAILHKTEVHCPSFFVHLSKPTSIFYYSMFFNSTLSLPLSLPVYQYKVLRLSILNITLSRMNLFLWKFYVSSIYIDRTPITLLRYQLSENRDPITTY